MKTMGEVEFEEARETVKHKYENLGATNAQIF
jgi:hypothetical protein